MELFLQPGLNIPEETHLMKHPRHFPAALAWAAAAVLSLSAAPMHAASHRDAPGQLADPQANITDVYAFVTDTDTVTLAMNVYPFIDPDSGPIWPFFSSDVLYELHVKNNATLADGSPVFSGAAQISYQFRFSPPAYRNTSTILTEGRGTGLQFGPIERVGDKHQNMIQTFSVTRVDLGSGARTPLISNDPMILPPPNVGPRTTPLYNDANGLALPGATTEAGLDQYTKDATYSLGGNRRIFAGMREEGFYFDQGATFDLLNLRNPGIDTFKGLNVLSIVLQVPKSDLVAAGENTVPIIGVYATSSRRIFSIRQPVSEEGRDMSFSAGSFTTVSRMANPVFNEALVPLAKKDRYNQTRPGQGNDLEFRTFAFNPELAILINAAVLNSQNPTEGPIQTTGRDDLAAIYIPDLLKLDTSTAAVPLAGQEGFNRLSVFGGDTTPSAFQNKEVASGWPNGRRIGDDVIDIALTAIGSRGALPEGTMLGDNVNSNDVTYPTVFPYLGVPHSGFNHDHHGQPEPPAATTQVQPRSFSPTLNPRSPRRAPSRRRG